MLVVGPWCWHWRGWRFGLTLDSKLLERHVVLQYLTLPSVSGMEFAGTFVAMLVQQVEKATHARKKSDTSMLPVHPASLPLLSPVSWHLPERPAGVGAPRHERVSTAL